MRIAMLAPVSWQVPPDGYGPWEQVVYNLTEELVRRGHNVTLFAAKGSKTSAGLVETVEHPFSLWPEEEANTPRAFDPRTGLLEGPPDFRALEQMHVAHCMEAAASGAFEIVHSHLHVHALVFSRLIPCPLVSSLHGAAWSRSTHPVFDRYRDLPYVSLSNAERTLKPDLNYVATVYNGIELDKFRFMPEKEDFLLFAGRIAPEKGAAEAIQIALRSGRRLIMAGMIEEQHRDYFETLIKPHINGSSIENAGLLSQRDLAPLYQRAACVLFPISWCEPCSMVGIEAQACGTPIIGTPCGYLPELIQHAKTGFLASSIDQAVECVKHLDRIDPLACRRNIEQRFSIPKMAEGYERVYMNEVEKAAK